MHWSYNGARLLDCELHCSALELHSGARLVDWELHWSYTAVHWGRLVGSPQIGGNTSPRAEWCGLNIAISRSQMQIKRSRIPPKQ